MAQVGTFGGMITLVSVADGENEDYVIEVNHDKIYKFYVQSSSEPSFSPSSLVFKVYDATTMEVMQPSDYTSEISLIGRSSQIDNVWALLNRLRGYPLVETSPQAENLLTAVREIDTTLRTVNFNFIELFGYDVNKPELNNASADIVSFNRLLRILTEENCYFIIEIYQNGSFLGSKPVSVEFGVSDDMAKFAVTAATIEAAVSNTKLQFDIDGLTIRNGGFTIYNEDNNKIFYYDDDAHSLYVEGTGTFTGEIYASAGSFAGDVTADNLIANAGTIGGFIIQNDGLFSRDANQSLKLYSDGQIDAENINLGVGAHINRYIQLGDKAFLWNPDDTDSNGYIIEIRNDSNADIVTLDDRGVFRLGEIVMDGRYSTISGDAFTITPRLATFSNVNVTGKISTAIFELGHIQAVGGLMMFKPSYKIEGREDNILTLDQEFKGEIGNYVYAIDEDGNPISELLWITDKNENIVTLNDITYSGKLIGLIDIGVENDLIIGVNSTNTASTYLKPRGFTISEFKLADDPDVPGTKYIDETVTPKVFLGDLDTSNIHFSDTPRETRGFGLYSENVYLTGSLTTKINTLNPTFAGVNTLDGVSATVFVERSYGDDTSPIVFWAGSTGTEARQIQTAPFQVTANGSIYATQGIFTGAIITESYITGADLYAARIHGTGTEQEGYGLAIYDCTKGIVFFEGEQTRIPEPTEVFSIGTHGLKKGNDYFIEVESNSSDVNFKGNNFIGNNYYTDKNQLSYIRLYQNHIYGAHIINEDEDSIDANITFNRQGIVLGASIYEGMHITQDAINMHTDNVQIDNTVLFGEQLKYEKVEDGYNLFVSG